MHYYVEKIFFNIACTSKGIIHILHTIDKREYTKRIRVGYDNSFSKFGFNKLPLMTHNSMVMQ